MMKYLLLLNVIVAVSGTSFAQKETFSVVSYILPQNWQQQQSEGGLQLSITDPKNGGYAIAVITKAMASTVSANANFTADWNKLVKGTVQVSSDPIMGTPAKQNGWEVLSGGANYTDDGNTGIATLLTATGGGQAVSVVLMTNTKQYENDLSTFLNTLELSKALQNIAGKASSVTKGEAGKTSVVGLWCNNILETTGTYVNGFPQYTAGYMRSEYVFYPDGTYLFRNKQWQTLMKDILFVYETGTYSVNGNQLTINPQKGKGGWWGKKDNNTRLWGSLVKAADYKQEKITYYFEIKYYSGSQDYSLILKPGKPTQRDGGSINNPNDQQYEIGYKLFENNKSIIDNPPGFKTDF